MTDFRNAGHIYAYPHVGVMTENSGVISSGLPQFVGCGETEAPFAQLTNHDTKSLAGEGNLYLSRSLYIQSEG